MPKAWASSPTRRPMRPIADEAHRLARQLDQRRLSRSRSPASAPSRRRRRPAACRPTWWHSSSSRAKTNWATESVPYSGTFDTGMPRRLAAATSTQSKPVALTAMKRRSGSRR